MQTAPRRNDLDWLRIFATFLLFPFHIAMVFNPAPFYHVRNGELSMAMLVFCGFVSLWHMPLFFLLAGWSAHGSLRTRGAGGFARERFTRLLVPLITGCVLFGAPIKYVELSSGMDLNHHGLRVRPELQEGFKMVIPAGLDVAPPFDQSFVEFLPTYFTSLDRFTWSHLWFLAYLLTFSLLYLPLLTRALRSEWRITRLDSRWIYLPVLPLALIQVTLRPYWPGVQNLYDDWANFAYYSTYLFIGFLLAHHPALEEAVQREWKRALGVALAAMTVLLASVLGLFQTMPIILTTTAAAGWCFNVALLGFARSRLQSDHVSRSYFAEGSLPIYVLHQPAIVFIGYFLVQLPLGIATKFALLLVLSVAATLLAYHFVVRPFAVPRFLFGLRLRPGLAARPTSHGTPDSPPQAAGGATGNAGYAAA